MFRRSYCCCDPKTDRVAIQAELHQETHQGGDVASVPKLEQQEEHPTKLVSTGRGENVPY